MDLPVHAVGFGRGQGPSACRPAALRPLCAQEVEAYRLDNLVGTLTDLLDQLGIEQVRWAAAAVKAWAAVCCRLAALPALAGARWMGRRPPNRRAALVDRVQLQL